MYDSDGTCNLRWDLLNEDEEEWKIDSFIDEQEKKEEWKSKEKYYWKTKDGQFLNKDKLENKHIKNIVYKFGKDKLLETGHKIIVERFNKILKEENN